MEYVYYVGCLIRKKVSKMQKSATVIMNVSACMWCTHISRTTIARQTGMEMYRREEREKKREIEQPTCKKFYCLQAFAPFSKHKMPWMPYNTSHSKDMCALSIWVALRFVFMSKAHFSRSVPFYFATTHRLLLYDFAFSQFLLYWPCAHCTSHTHSCTRYPFLFVSYKWKW